MGRRKTETGGIKFCLTGKSEQAGALSSPVCLPTGSAVVCSATAHSLHVFLVLWELRRLKTPEPWRGPLPPPRVPPGASGGGRAFHEEPRFLEGLGGCTAGPPGCRDFSTTRCALLSTSEPSFSANRNQFRQTAEIRVSKCVQKNIVSGKWTNEA